MGFAQPLMEKYAIQCEHWACALYSRGIIGDVFLFSVVAAGRQVHEVFLLGVEHFEEEAALVRVSQVPGHVERRPRF